MSDPAAPGAEQAGRVVALLQEILPGAVLCVSLHGSSASGGLRPTSDLDLFAVTSRRTRETERRDLIARLLPISGPGDPSGASRSIDLAIVAHADVHPWRYPTRLDFQFGDWYRESFAQGDLAPWNPADPDLTITLAMVLQADRPLFGPPPSGLFGPVPWGDVRRAMLDTLPDLLSYLDGDERNVILTFARVWATLATGTFMSKDGAADWAAARLRDPHRAVMERARELYVDGIPAEDWGALGPRIRPCVAHVIGEIRALPDDPGAV